MTGWMHHHHVWAGLASIAIAIIVIACSESRWFNDRVAINAREQTFNSWLLGVWNFLIGLDLLIVAMTVSYWLHLIAVAFAAAVGSFFATSIIVRVALRWGN